MSYILYRKGYKYQLASTVSEQVPIHLGEEVSTDFLRLQRNGHLTILHGYAWDGPSGPAVDTRSFMRASLVHDALYQLMRMGLLPQSARAVADQTMRRIAREDGMPWIRRVWTYWAVRRWAKAAADPKNRKPILRAPLR